MSKTLIHNILFDWFPVFSQWKLSWSSQIKRIKWSFSSCDCQLVRMTNKLFTLEIMLTGRINNITNFERGRVEIRKISIIAILPIEINGLLIFWLHINLTIKYLLDLYFININSLIKDSDKLYQNRKMTVFLVKNIKWISFCSGSEQYFSI